MLDLVAPVGVGRELVRGRMQARFDEAGAGTQTHLLTGYWRAQPGLPEPGKKAKISVVSRVIVGIADSVRRRF
jgi:hypothetical protein